MEGVAGGESAAMNAMHTLRFSVKIVLLVGLLAVGAFALARESRPAQADTTQLYLAASSSCGGSGVSSVVLLLGSTGQDLYLCTKDIDDPYGAAAFTLDFSYGSWLVGVQSASVDDPAFLPTGRGLAQQWLGSTGRVTSCLAPTIAPHLDTGLGRVDGGCSTLSPPPPNGADTVAGPATLAKIRLSPGITKALTNVDFRGATGTSTQLVSANFQGGPNPAILIPATPPLLSVYISGCGDFTGPGGVPEGRVTIADILYEAGKFGARPGGPTPPGWNPNWDMDGGNSVNIQDILIVAKEFGMAC